MAVARRAERLLVERLQRGYSVSARHEKKEEGCRGERERTLVGSISRSFFFELLGASSCALTSSPNTIGTGGASAAAASDSLAILADSERGVLGGLPEVVGVVVAADDEEEDEATATWAGVVCCTTAGDDLRGVARS